MPAPVSVDAALLLPLPRHTPGPWKWWTSNSWRRLKRDERGVTQNVLEPYVARDGHPDLSVSAEDMALIEAAPEMYAALSSLLNCIDGHHDSEWLDRCKSAALTALAKAEGLGP